MSDGVLQLATRTRLHSLTDGWHGAWSQHVGRGVGAQDPSPARASPDEAQALRGAEGLRAGWM